MRGNSILEVELRQQTQDALTAIDERAARERKQITEEEANNILDAGEDRNQNGIIDKAGFALPAGGDNMVFIDFTEEIVQAKVGYAAAERHFSAARLSPEALMIESDKDLRTPANMMAPSLNMASTCQKCRRSGSTLMPVRAV